MPRRDELRGGVRKIRVHHHRVRFDALSRREHYAPRAPSLDPHLRDGFVHAKHRAEVLRAPLHPPRESAKSALHVPHAEREFDVGNERNTLEHVVGCSPRYFDGYDSAYVMRSS